MRSLKFALTLAAALVGTSTVASAETRLLKVPTRYLIVPPMEAGAKRLQKDSTAFEFPMRWDEAATMSEQVQVNADDRTLIIQKGQVLVRTALQFDSPEFAGANSFCVPRKAAPVDDRVATAWLGSLGMKLLRSQTDGQFCLIDRDNDGRIDHSVLINDGTPAARMPRQVAPAPYEFASGAPVWEGDKVTVVYLGKYNFRLDFEQQGTVRQFDSYSNGTRTFMRQARGTKAADGTYIVALPGIALTALTYDKASGSVLVRWPATTEPMILPIPEDVKGVYRYGY